MTSKEDDDTFPLTRFSAELMVDASVDEDFIPTSQPQSIRSCKSLKKTVTNFEKCDEEEGTSTPEPSLSATDPATLILSAIDQSPDEDKSADFIPDTETKKRKFDYSKEEGRGSKKVREDSFVKCTEDIFESESDSPWESEVSKVAESAFSKCGRRNDDGVSKNERNFEECITEIIVNDSAETVDLDGSENLSLLRKKKKGRESEPSEGKMSVSCSLNSDVERCEETHIFDNSSILLLDQPEVSGSKFADSQSSVISAKLYLEETIEDKESSKDKDGVSESGCVLMPAAMVKMPKESSTEKSTTELVDTLRQKENFNSKFEQNCIRSNTENFDPSNFVETRKVEMKLSVSCKVTANIKTKQVLQKLILSVNELPTCKPKSKCTEHNSDSASDNSKRQSTSSSGSVYSDKTGLPFALPQRVYATSDQTDASDSSDEWFSKRLRDGQKVFERMPWTNEYLLPLKMDELIKVPIENQETLPKATNMPFPRKFKPWNRRELNYIEEILESSSFEHTSVSHTFVTDSKTGKLLKADTGNCIMKDEGEDLKPGQTVMQIEEISQNESCEDNVYNSESRQNDQIEKVDLTESRDKQVGMIKDQEDFEQEKLRAKGSEENKDDRENDLVELREGLPVFARWTDKRYYSGVLCGTPKNYRWDIKFDDGTTKTIREEFLMPAKWLKVGELAFALVNDKYQSGQIAEVECGENETKYLVELDSEKKSVTVKASDLCLSEVMANIVRERYKPLNATPRGKVSSDINFDNVIIGKRVREQRTPLRTTIATPAGNSEPEKKSSNTKKRDVKFSESQEASAQGNPQNKISSFRGSGNKSNGLISEKGHLVEDKDISGDSPSRNETKQNCKRTRGKAKPRSLTYEPAKDRKEDKLKCSIWVNAEGTPIPGPSGIKLKTRTKPGSKKAETVPGFVEDTSVCVARSSGESLINERFNWRNPKAAESKKSRSGEKSKNI